MIQHYNFPLKHLNPPYLLYKNFTFKKCRMLNFWEWWTNLSTYNAGIMLIKVKMLNTEGINKTEGQIV